MRLIGELNLSIDRVFCCSAPWVLAKKSYPQLLILCVLINPGKGVAEDINGTLDTRLNKIEAILASKALIDLSLQVDRLEQEVRILRGAIENQNFATETFVAEFKKSIEIASRRIDAIEPDQEIKVAQVEIPESGAEESAAISEESTIENRWLDPPKDQEIIVAPEPILDPNTMFDDAVGLLKSGDYIAATKSFSTFYTLYPDHDFADDALYRAAEALYLRRDFTEAIIAYDRMINIFPASVHRAAAMLKLAYSHHELGDDKAALRVVKELKSLYPASLSAQLASDRMSRIGSSD
jgi:tol-pal system protein YbgF